MTMKRLRSLAVRSLFAAVAGAAAMAPASAYAQFVIPLAPTDHPDLVTGGNRWTITAYNDASPNHDQWATQGICFRFIGTVGTHNRYQWWSDTFPDWNGIATQEGDEIFMHGDYANDVGHDGMKWSVVTSSYRNIGAGHWFEWREDGGYGRTIGFANALLNRVGYCRLTIDEAKLLPLPYDYFTGRQMESPFGNLELEVPKQ
jgi:hypothetical protein